MFIEEIFNFCLANAMSEKYTTGDKSGANLKALSQYIKSAIELAK